MKNTKDIKEENHLALYRKYRPQRFEDVLGQESVLATLENAIKQNKLYHAYLFSGDRGTGKTTVARIFAREIGCTPDDIFELDAASNNSVEDIRLLIDAAQSSTFGSRYKVYILDEAHMLSKAAFNALLKTLEEPPAHVIFILATTDKHKLPTTIISRCQDINFSSPNIKTLEDLIDNVSKKENKTIDTEAKQIIAAKAKGSFRDMLGILEKVFTTVSKDNIVKKDLESILGITSNKKILALLKAFCDDDINSFLNLFENELNLNTIQAIDSIYIEFVKFFEISLYARFLDGASLESNFEHKIGEADLKELKDISTKYSDKISATNLYSLLQIEKDFNSDSIQIKKSVLMIGILKLIKEKV